MNLAHSGSGLHSSELVIYAAALAILGAILLATKGAKTGVAVGMIVLGVAGAAASLFATL